MLYKTFYLFDIKTGEFSGEIAIQENPKYTGVFLTPPHNAIEKEPPPSPPRRPLENKTIIINSTQDGWNYIYDYRGTVYKKADGSIGQYTKLGDLPPELTQLQPSSEYDIWDSVNNLWTLDLPIRHKRLLDKYVDLIDQDACRTRHLYIICDNAIIEYDLASKQADEYENDGYHGVVPNCVQIWMQYTGLNAKRATKDMIKKRKEFHTVIEKIMETRLLAKIAFKAFPISVTPDEFEKEYQKHLEKLNTIK